MGVQLEEIKEYIVNQHDEIKKLEGIIGNQPPQHEVQRLKRHYYDLLDKVSSVSVVFVTVIVIVIFCIIYILDNLSI